MNGSESLHTFTQKVISGLSTIIKRHNSIQVGVVRLIIHKSVMFIIKSLLKIINI